MIYYPSSEILNSRKPVYLDEMAIQAGANLVLKKLEDDLIEGIRSLFPELQNSY